MVFRRFVCTHSTGLLRISRVGKEWSKPADSVLAVWRFDSQKQGAWM